MGYYSVPRERWLSFLDIEDGDVPERLVLEGHVHWPRMIDRRSLYLENVRDSWMPNLILGGFGEELVGYGVCFGGPVASQFTHIYCKLGTGKVIHIGTTGGLQPEMDLGDIVVSEGVLSLDGSAGLYRHDGDTVRFDRALVRGAVRELERCASGLHVGMTVSFYDILLEETGELEGLSERGFLGMEMEAAAVGAVASHFGTPALSVQTVSDNPVSGKDLFYSRTKEETNRIQEGLDTIFQVALRV